MAKVPKEFLETLQALDMRLNVRPCSIGEGFVVERDLSATDNATIDELKRIWERYSKRKINPKLPAAVRAQKRAKKIEAAERLASAHGRRRFLFSIPDCSPTTLKDCLYTLKTTDLWDKGDGFKGDVDKHADRLQADGDYQDEQDERKREVAFADYVHATNKEIFRWTQLRLGETTVG